MDICVYVQKVRQPCRGSNILPRSIGQSMLDKSKTKAKFSLFYRFKHGPEERIVIILTGGIDPQWLEETDVLFSSP